MDASLLAEKEVMVVVVPAQVTPIRKGRIHSRAMCKGGNGRQTASEFQTRLELRPPSSTIVCTTTTFTSPLPFFYLKAMSKSSQTMDPLIDMMDPAHRRLYEEVVNKKADLQRQLQLSLSSLFLDLLQSTEVELARCKDYQRKETLLRELVAEIEGFKPGMRQIFGEDSGAFCRRFVLAQYIDFILVAYSHLLLEEKLASHR